MNNCKLIFALIIYGTVIAIDRVTAFKEAYLFGFTQKTKVLKLKPEYLLKCKPVFTIQSLDKLYFKIGNRLSPLSTKTIYYGLLSNL